jgi:protein associated with RNAse G/E
VGHGPVAAWRKLRWVRPPVGARLWVERCKWPDAPHYGAEGVVLGEDDHGVWVGAEAGHTVHRGPDELFVGPYAVVWCVPRDDWFMAHFLVGHPRLDIYVDVITPAVWNERGARMVDLDFDVVVWRDDARMGVVELVDADEFEQHRVELAYPDELVADARRAAGDVFARVQARTGPFSGTAAAPWLAALADIAR